MLSLPKPLIKSRKRTLSFGSRPVSYTHLALPYLAPVLSPMLAHCKLIKEQNPEAKTVFIGPCISKKEEAELYDYCDAVLTFEELEAWLSLIHI